MTFTMWSFGHYAFLASPIVFTALLHYLTRNLTQDQKRTVGIYLSIAAIVILLLRNIEIWVRDDYAFSFELVPLQVCHFANFVLLYAFLKRSDTAFSLAFTLNLAAAYVSILFADGLENYSTLINFRGFAYIVGHALIVVITVWAFMNNFIFITTRTYLKTVLTVGILYITSILINNLFGVWFGSRANYFYTEHPEKGTPLETFWDMGKLYSYGWFEINYIYLLLTMLLGAVITITVWGISVPLQKNLQK